VSQGQRHHEAKSKDYYELLWFENDRYKLGIGPGFARGGNGRRGEDQAHHDRQKPTGSVYFPLSGGFAKLFQTELKIRSTAQPHAGASVYLPLMNKGEIVLGLNSSLDSGMAVSGKAPFKAKMRNVRMIARVWILPFAYMVKENSGIKNVADFRGKRVPVKVKTNVSHAQANRTLLSTAGLSESDVTATDSGGVVADINSVVEGRAEATTIALTMPAMRKAHASVPGGLRVLGLGPKATDAFLARGMAGLYTMIVKSSKHLPYVRAETLIAAFDSYLNARSQVDNEDAYKLARTLHTNWKSCKNPIRRCAGPRRRPCPRQKTRCPITPAPSAIGRKSGCGRQRTKPTRPK
jgi:TRAP transporter TAXI family solute receptor